MSNRQKKNAARWLYCLLGAWAMAMVIGGACEFLRPAYGGVGPIPPASSSGVTQSQVDVASIIGGRRYEVVKTVGSGTAYDYQDVATAVAAITDSSIIKRYKLMVASGTYAGTIDLTGTGKHYVDIIGVDKATTHLVSSATALLNDTVLTGGTNALLANLTITHSTINYGIHCDTSNSGDIDAPQTVIYNCDVASIGKSAIGFGLHPNERIYLINSKFTSSATNYAGIFGHNYSSGSTNYPSAVYVVSCTATAPTYGINYNNYGTTQPDEFWIRGGTFAGGTADINIGNNSSPAGASETILYIDGSTYTRSSIVAGTRYAVNANLPLPRLRQTAVWWNEPCGLLKASPSGAQFGADGMVTGDYKGIVADKVTFPTTANTFFKSSTSAALLNLTVNGTSCYNAYANKLAVITGLNVGSTSDVSGFRKGQFALTFTASVAAGGTVDKTVALTGMDPSSNYDMLMATPRTDPGSAFTWQVYPSGTNQATVRYFNISGTAAQPTNHTMVVGGIKW